MICLEHQAIVVPSLNRVPIGRLVETKNVFERDSKIPSIVFQRGTITSAPISMKSPFWSSDKKAWKSSNGFVNLDAEPIVMATPPKQVRSSDVECFHPDMSRIRLNDIGPL